MLNKEKFEKEILDIACTGAKLALNKKTNTLTHCNKISCDVCAFSSLTGKCSDKTIEWCNSEYREPEVDWSRVPVDTPVLVNHCETDSWTNRYFACYKDGKVFTYDCGATSWSTPTDDDISSWKYVKLANEEDIKKYAKID